MSHEVESMAWAHEVPWHGLGNRVEGNVTCDEMLVAAGLDWTVEQIPCFIEIDGQKVAVERKALVRSSDKKILTVTGNNWRPFQNKDAMNFFRDWAAVGGCTLETAGSLHGGKVGPAFACDPGRVHDPGGDPVKAYDLAGDRYTKLVRPVPALGHWQSRQSALIRWRWQVELRARMQSNHQSYKTDD